MTNIPYWQQRQKMKLGQKSAKEQEKEDKEDRKKKGEYFAQQIAKAPQCCENCGASLFGTRSVNPAAIVCHIVPKSKQTGCPSVSRHPLNRWYGCDTCHYDYDNKGKAFVLNMPIFPALVERMKLVYPNIAENERRRVPEYYRPQE